ncbi:serine/threonine-protein kinase [Crossiella equi]|uniref:non-specific serine/threonine protein kinase n=1 Tax=Crossiella equi TaxID=130796 RepID=A0ABS5A813_9PSEU|nr:serine/threonine-protein kinase [Crossiella equi]MBP2472715.1 serine/threonine-protein kinase [Crossiella equi]
MGLLDPGDEVNGLLVERRLGEGAFAEVYRVRHRVFGPLAMKVFKLVGTEHEAARLLEEARLLSRLGHPHIVRVFDAGTLPTAAGARGYFTVELVPGGSLERLLAEHPGRPVPVAEAVEVVEQITEGLAAAHRQDPPVLHRDLTLANVLLGQDGRGGRRVLLSDFGLARHADPVTRLASAQGTFAFLAPEVQRRQGYSAAADVYSVGTIAYHLLTRHFPYTDDPRLAPFALARFEHPARPPSQFNDEVDPELDAIVLGALDRDPGTRIPHAMALADRLRARRASVPRQRDCPHGAGHADGERRARAALTAARTPGGLPGAVAQLTGALDCCPCVRRRHGHRLALWRRGVVM